MVGCKPKWGFGFDRTQTPNCSNIKQFRYKMKGGTVVYYGDIVVDIDDDDDDDNDGERNKV